MKAKNMTIAALALLLAACGNEEIIENNESGSTGKVHMTFTAGMPQTRTSLGEDGHAVNWTQGDLVAIYDGTETICKFEATEVSGSTATLEGEAKVTDTYTAFYPYTDDGTLTLDNTAITFTLPATQTALRPGQVHRGRRGCDGSYPDRQPGKRRTVRRADLHHRRWYADRHGKRFPVGNADGNLHERRGVLLRRGSRHADGRHYPELYG